MILTDKWWEHPVLVARFDMRYKRGAPTECWPWVASKTSKGYGTISIGTKGKRLAHRLALERKLGRSLGIEWAIHSCDNPSCVNPSHLRPGGAQENNADKKKRNRCRNGDQQKERNGAAKLTNAQVDEIRRLLQKGGLFQWQIAKLFGVSQSTVSEIKNRRHWK